MEIISISFKYFLTKANQGNILRHKEGLFIKLFSATVWDAPP